MKPISALPNSQNDAGIGTAEIVTLLAPFCLSTWLMLISLSTAEPTTDEIAGLTHEKVNISIAIEILLAGVFTFLFSYFIFRLIKKPSLNLETSCSYTSLEIMHN